MCCLYRFAWSQMLHLMFFHHEAHEEHTCPVGPADRTGSKKGENNIPLVKIAGFIFLSFPSLFVIPAPICHFRESGNP